MALYKDENDKVILDGSKQTFKQDAENLVKKMKTLGKSLTLYTDKEGVKEFGVETFKSTKIGKSKINSGNYEVNNGIIINGLELVNSNGTKSYSPLTPNGLTTWFAHIYDRSEDAPEASDVKNFVDIIPKNLALSYVKFFKNSLKGYSKNEKAKSIVDAMNVLLNTMNVKTESLFNKVYNILKENENVVIYYNQDKPTNYVTIDTNLIKYKPDQDKSKPVVINYWVGRLTADAKKSGKWNVTAGSNLSKSVWVASVEEAVIIVKKEKYTEKA